MERSRLSTFSRRGLIKLVLTLFGQMRGAEDEIPVDRVSEEGW